MANYYCAARTNYFRVDPAKREAFDAFAKRLRLTVQPEPHDADLLACFPGADDGAFPSVDPEKEAAGEPSDIDFIQTLASFLAPGSIAVIVEAGAEKLRYVSGVAVAVDRTGHEVSLDLNEIYALARSTFDGAEVTAANY